MTSLLPLLAAAAGLLAQAPRSHGTHRKNAQETTPPEAAPAQSEPIPSPAEVPPPPQMLLPPAAPVPMPMPAPQAWEGPPLAGWSDGTAFLRSADDMFFLFPSGRLQIDGYFFKRPTDDMPTDSFIVRRARLEAAGWIGKWFGFSIGGDFAAGAPAGADPIAQSWIATTDAYVMVAPWENLAILQVGQYDAPFTLENRTSDKYFDFMERSLTVRAFGIPSNKEVGAMVHGLAPEKVAYYSLGVFNGDGQNFRNVDNDLDLMGRFWVAPLALAKMPDFAAIEVGGSFWIGQRDQRGTRGLPLAPQTTQGGFRFFDTKWTGMNAMGMSAPMELHQKGDLREWALELDAPLMHKYGVRFELVHKRQELDIDDITATSTGKLTVLGPSPGAILEGWSAYGEAWVWVMGDDTIIGPPGLQMPTRIKKFGTKPPQHGVMVALRVEHLDESISPATAGGSLMGAVSAGNTLVNSAELGINYWYSKRFRGTFNYVANIFDDSATFHPAQLNKANIQNGKSDAEHEFLLRLGIAL